MTHLMLSYLIGAFLFPLSSSWTNVISTRHQMYQARMSPSILNISGNSEVMDNGEESVQSIEDLLSPNTKCTPTQMSPTSLAYIGDSVFELFVRSRYVWPTRRTTDLQNLVVGRVRAETQSKMFRNLLSSEKIQLTKEEQTIISRGRNAGSSSGGRKRGPKRLYATNNGKKSEAGGPEVYQDSTAMEALIGYAYLTDKERCTELIKYFADELDMMDDEENVAR